MPDPRGRSAAGCPDAGLGCDGDSESSGSGDEGEDAAAATAAAAVAAAVAEEDPDFIEEVRAFIESAGAAASSACSESAGEEVAA